MGWAELRLKLGIVALSHHGLIFSDLPNSILYGELYKHVIGRDVTLRVFKPDRPRIAL